MPVPRATYRLQLRPGFDFDAAAELADYLAALGVSHLYASPYLQAAPGSTHGYDVVDPRRVNEELGGAPAHMRFSEALERAGLGQVLDLVPNHMAIPGRPNAWWWDVLENGPSSRYASYFDVDWDPPDRKLRNTVLMPVLADHYGRVLEAGEIRMERDGGELGVRYFEHELPVAPRSLYLVLEPAARASGSEDLGFIAKALRDLPVPALRDSVAREERHRDLAVLKRQLSRLLAAEPDTAVAVDREIERLNGDPDVLDALLDAQNYRLAFWRTASEELDYRRFFDIDSLVALRTEDPEVFRATHGLVLRWLQEGVLDGLRIDHPDGLRRPDEYFVRLRAAAPDAWIVAEKILEPGEPLRERWPLDGTTGYDFLNDVTALFVDPAGEEPLTRIYAEATGTDADYAEIVHASKHAIMRESLSADVRRLVDVFVEVCERHRRYRDYTRRELEAVLREVAACFPVYRAYVDDAGTVEPEDRRVIGEALEAARRRRDDLDAELFEFFGRILLADPELAGPLDTELRTRFQQLTGPVMAKGVEDTAFYLYVRFVALNEVGGDPGRFGADPAEFHARCRRAGERWPHTMLSLSTHDTKRSEDVRARLALLSEIPERWGEAVGRWMRRAERYRRGPELPDRNTEYLLHQTLVGAHPLSLERARSYMEKAAREAKAHTSWTDRNPEFEIALTEFVEGLFEDDEFQRDLAGFVEPLVGPGRTNALAQKLVQLTAPGVPDVYQGTELWDLSLVDPDNRRPVDFDRRRRLLDELDRLEVDEVRARGADGLPKLLVVREALGLRAERPEAFGEAGGYRALEARGPRARHVVAFSRGGSATTVVPRLVLTLEEAGGWEGTEVELPAGRWVNRLTGDRHDGGRTVMAELLSRFPVALLAREGGSG